MENSQLIGLSRQVALRREMDVVANNLANMNTAGFKRQSMIFEEYIMPVAEFDTQYLSDRPLSYVQDRATYRDYVAGTITPTGGDLDVALGGDSWLVVESADGERYTRNGALTLSPAGELVTQSGEPVLGDDGPIVVPPNAGRISIARDGTVNAGELVLGRIQTVRFEDQQNLEPAGGNLFRAEEPPIPVEIREVLQGVIEGSNVEPVWEMTRMIEVQRAYESLSRSIQRTDELRRTAIQRLGQLQA